MSTRSIWRNRRALHLVSAWAGGLALLVGLLLTMAAARPADGSGGALAVPSLPVQNHPPDEFSVITHTTSQERVAISGDCVAFRDGDGGVYLHNLTTRETMTITDKAQPVRKVVVSQGVVVWRSDYPGEEGLWGYYNPSCSDAGPFTPTEIITPFYIVSRANAHAPALSEEMLTFDTSDPKGYWYVALIELDADDNGIPDAVEGSYDPTDDSILIPLSYTPNHGADYVQRVSDIYWDDDYRIACWYDDSLGVDSIGCNDLHHLDDPDPWTYRFPVATSTWIPLDWKGIVAVYRDLVVWTDARDFDLSGYDLYIADLDLDDDGILNPVDSTPGDGPALFTLVNYPWHQAYPDIGGFEESPGVWRIFAVWADRRNGNQEDIYAYDLTLDSDGDGVVNWKDPDRPCIDPAEFRVTFDPAAQTQPEIWDSIVVWEDYRNGNWDIYGAYLQPVQPQPRVPVGGTAQQRAIHWLDHQTEHFSQVQYVPGYVAATGMITRYKSFSQTGAERVRRAWYSPTVGAYLVSFDYCYFGTPAQKRYLGRFGRGFAYDQGLVLIARTMLSQPAQADAVGHYVFGFQNSGQLSTTVPGSFGFSFNGQGYWGEKDNFYDMDYLRIGANAWLGYGLLFYTRQYTGVQFMGTITRAADYILDHQVITPTDERYGLFTGGYGSWISETDVFTDENITWVATEHNIDVYFFLRDLGQMTGESRYAEAAELLKVNVHKLWDDEKGRLNQGMGVTGTLNTNDALDAASWGAMYWTAVGDLEKAKRSLEYADRAYSNTVTISNTGLISTELSIWGYKPYTGIVDGFDWSAVNMVWSEGSLGVAMAHLKLGHAMLDRGYSQGGVYIQQGQDILAEMEKLQRADFSGGLLYAVSDVGIIADFPEAPSAAGTTWLLMVQQAMKDKAMRDAFWGPDQALINRVVITGPMTGWVGTAYTFTATVDSITATLPITYFWQASGQDSPTTHTSGLSDTVTWSWTMPGIQLITVTATNARDTAVDTHAITAGSYIYLPIVFKNHTA
jgi:beta propeller repeat protein